MCKAKPHPSFFWKLRNLTVCMLAVPECLQSYSWCLSTAPGPKDLSLTPAPTLSPCMWYQLSSLNMAVLCALTPSKAERGVRITQLSKRAEGHETSLHSFSDSCCYYKLVCVLPCACLFLSRGGGGGLGSLELTPGHPENKGRVVLLKSRTEAKLLPPEKGGNRGGPVAWRGVSGL